MPLSETTLLKAAGDLVYARGEDYVRYVRGLRTTDFKAYASIQAKNVYQVELDWSGPLPDGSCTCRHHADGNFCKHLVATGLAAIDTGRVAVDDTASSTAEAALEAAVQAMDVDELRELVMTLAQRDDGVRRLLEIRATTAAGDDTHAKAELEAYVRKTLAFRGFVDYRRSFEVAGVASEVLDELENHLEQWRRRNRAAGVAARTDPAAQDHRSRLTTPRARSVMNASGPPTSTRGPAGWASPTLSNSRRGW